jgi:hypothetical protein
MKLQQRKRKGKKGPEHILVHLAAFMNNGQNSTTVPH